MRVFQVVMTVVLVGAAWAGESLGGGLLDPAQFASLGAMPAGVALVQVNTDTDLMRFPDGSTLSGVLSGDVAVWTFDSIPLIHLTVVGSHPLALLSHGDMVFGDGLVNPGGSGGPGHGGGDPTILQPPYFVGGGGGFAGAGGMGGGTTLATPSLHPGWPSPIPGGPGGATYSGFHVGSSGGAGGGTGGLGGGAIELGATGTLTLFGRLSVNGATPAVLGGGGSGGFIGLRAQSVVNHGSLSVRGGDGGHGISPGGYGGWDAAGGGGGGGGWIVVEADSFANVGGLDLAGGNGGVGNNPVGSQAGNSGVFINDPPALPSSPNPEPSTLVILLTAMPLWVAIVLVRSIHEQAP